MRHAVLARFVALACAVCAACSGGKDDARDGAPQPPGVDPQAVLRDLGTVVIVPGYRQLHERAQAMTQAARSLCSQPGEDTLVAMQEAWRAVRVPWKASEAFAFGPVVELRIDSAVDFWPVRASSVEEELARTTPVAEDYAASLGDTVKGLPVLEYILFDAAGDNAAVLARLRQESDGQATRTCQYVVALAVDVELRSRTVLEAWAPTGGNFVNQLATAGMGSTVYDKRADAIDAVVNAFVLLLQEVEGIKLATPLGRRDGGVAQPQAVESRRSGNGTQDILDNLAGVRSMYTSSFAGQTGVSFHDAVNERNPELAAAILAQLDAATAAVQAIELPLDKAVVETPATVQAAFESTQELYRLMYVDMVTLLGVTLTFSDNDGD